MPVEVAWFGFLNVYLVFGERVVVVDAGYPQSTGRVLEALEREAVRPADVSLILLTHGHLDHLGGARQLREALDAPIALHRLDVEIARTGKDRPLIPTDLAGRLFLPFMPRTIEPLEPDIVHDGELDLAQFGIAGRTIHTPGHTPGSISVVLEDATLGGDTVAGGFLRRHSPRLPYFADDRDALRQSQARLVKEARGTIHVGHRGPLTRAAIARRFGLQMP